MKSCKRGTHCIIRFPFANVRYSVDGSSMPCVWISRCCLAAACLGNLSTPKKCQAWDMTLTWILLPYQTAHENSTILQNATHILLLYSHRIFLIYFYLIFLRCIGQSNINNENITVLHNIFSHKPRIDAKKMCCPNTIICQALYSYLSRLQT